MSNLFICGTPLQSIIAARIIEERNLRREDCCLFFYSSVKNEKYDHYYRFLSKKCATSVFYYHDFRFPKYLMNAKKILSDFRYETVFLASVTSVFSFLALSQNRQRALYTFDDGTANISPSSPYARKYGLSFRKYIALCLLGNRYTANRIRRELKGHYTIYPNFSNNVSDRLIPISVFSNAEKPAKSGSCSVILGTVFGEAFQENYIDYVTEKISEFAASLDETVYFIPHPREKENRVSNCHTIESEKIAEDIIIGLREEYGTVNLYGFCSSAQINLGHIDSIRNTFFTAKGVSSLVDNMYMLAARAQIPTQAIIDLDQY